jgi:5S rRNA maturation endonuclease (ribonuclease M5)
MSRGVGFAKLVTALQDHGCAPRDNDARCPAHDDTDPSLSIGQGNAGAFLKCHAGCATEDVLEALSLSYGDLFDEPHPGQRNGRAWKVADTYTYTDEHGKPLFYAERLMPKDFRQYRIVNGRKVYKLGDVRRVLYRLPKVLAAAACGDVVYVAEGEKDVHSLERAGAVATCNPMGALKWNRPEYAESLTGAHVIIVADRDDNGRKHARQVAASLAGKAASVRTVEAAEGKDASDHLAAGHSLADFREAEPARAAIAVSGAVLLDAVAEFLLAYVAFPSADAAIAVTLWAAHTHLAAAFESTPRLALLSPEKQCGKSRVLELLDLLCADPETLSDASPAYLYRRIGAGPLTILLDECDAIWRRGKSGKDETAEALRSVINAGHRKSATVGRVEMNGQAAALKRFPVYAPAALAGIGTLPDTIMDRAVVIRMRRRAPDETIRAFRERMTRPEGEQLRDELAKWALDVAQLVGEPWPDMPPGVTDRPADVWEPLLMVADLAGGGWPHMARAACTALVNGARDDTATAGVRLLADIRAVWSAGTDGTSGTLLASDVPDVPLVPHIGTQDLLRRLCALDESPWADWYGKPLDDRGLARALKNYDIRSAKVRIGELSVRGYRRDDFREAWRRYASDHQDGDQ